MLICVLVVFLYLINQKIQSYRTIISVIVRRHGIHHTTKNHLQKNRNKNKR